MGDQPTIVISADGPLDDTARERIRTTIDEWRASESGVLVLGGGLRVEHYGFDPKPLTLDALHTAASVGRGTRLMVMLSLLLSTVALYLSLQ